MLSRGPSLALLLIGILSSAAAAAPIEGPWLTEDRGGVIRIEPCGTALCGRIVGIGSFAPDGAPPKDLEGRSECGLEIMQDLVESEPGRWYGTVTDPETGRSYNIRLSLGEQGQLRLRGYLAIPLFGATQTWTAYRGVLTADCRMTR